MRRFVNTILGGISLTAIVYLGSFAASILFHDFSQLPGYLNPMQKIVTFPFLWSTYLGEILFPQTYHQYGRTRIFSYYVWSCNIALYSTLVYLFLSFRDKLKKQKNELDNPPAPPPVF